MVMMSESSRAATPERLVSLLPPGKSQPLHNFSMPYLRWGHQKLLRCRKVDRNGRVIRSPQSDTRSDDKKSSVPRPSTFHRRISPSSSNHRHAAPRKSTSAVENYDFGVEKIREKLLVHLRTASNKLKFQAPQEATDGDSSARQWNLRTRRTPCNNHNEIAKSPKDLSASPPQNQLKSSRLRLLASEKNGEDERRKFSVALAKEEIEEDFFIITGSKPPRRAKKRARNIQRQLDVSFPGLWLSEIALENYRVSDVRESGNGQR